MDTIIGNRGIKFTRRASGIEISLPPQPFSQKSQEERYLIAWLVGISLMWGLAGLPELISSPSGTVNWLWGGIWLAIEGLTLYLIGRLLFLIEKIQVVGTTIIIGNYLFGEGRFRIGREKSTEFTDETTVRHILAKKFAWHKLSVKHGTRIIKFGRHLSISDADHLRKTLSDLLTFRCHDIETILFGACQQQEISSRRILQNPDVSDLSLPFVSVQRIVIHTETYPFHLVERFLTYAVNSLGQDYLKRSVDTHIYGYVESLHPNLRNTLTNLCRQVYEHKEEPCCLDSL